MSSNALSFQPQFETLLEDGLRLPGAAGDAEAAMSLALSLFERAGPKIGCRFVESCYLLTLGDMRPYGDWNGFLQDPQPSDDPVWDALNRELVPRGLSLHPARPRNGKTPSWGLFSLGGLELRTRQCSIEWVPLYQRSSWWQGFYCWRDRFCRLARSIWRVVGDGSMKG